jgi:hypothetical protein
VPEILVRSISLLNNFSNNRHALSYYFLNLTEAIIILMLYNIYDIRYSFVDYYMKFALLLSSNKQQTDSKKNLFYTEKDLIGFII